MFSVTFILDRSGCYAHPRTIPQNLCLFCSSAPLFAHCWPAKVYNIKLNSPVELMQSVPLAHSCADVLEHIPRCLIGHPKLGRKLRGGDPPVYLCRPGKKLGTRLSMAYGACAAPFPLLRRSGVCNGRIDTTHWTGGNHAGNRTWGRHTPLATAPIPNS